MKESWKIIENYTDYQISNYGNVKSLKFNKERILKPQNYKGYLNVYLLLNKNLKWYSVHRLVANAFITNPDNKPQVNHIDGDKLNNYVNNLEWVTCSENHKHAFKIGLKSINGEKHPSCKLTDNEVLAIHGLYLSGMTLTTISKLYNVTIATISYIVNGINWNHLL